MVGKSRIAPVASFFRPWREARTDAAYEGRTSMKFAYSATLSVATSLILLLSACGGGGGSSSGGGNTTPPPATTYTLTVDSVTPASGAAITVSPADNNSLSNGSSSFTRTYNSGTAVTLTAPATSSGNKFFAWTGCTTASTVTCNVTMSANETVTATYSLVTAISTLPASVQVGAQVQLAANVTGLNVTNTAVKWAIAPPSGSSLSAGTITSGGLYTTPFPAPATITVTATSVQDPNSSDTQTLTLALPAASSGPALSVDAGNQTHPISPLIYGMDAYGMTTGEAQAVNLTLDRWGGDATSRYNYLLDVTSSASDWYFENQAGLAGGNENTSSFNAQVTADAAVGAKTLGTLPVLGWVAKDATSCSYPTATYPVQQTLAPDRPCGNGVYPAGTGGCTNSAGCAITGNDPTVTSTAVTPTFAGNWVKFLVGKYGTAAKGGVAIYDLDNEPSWWDAVHRDVHPNPFTYDEATNNGIAVAQQVKTNDPTAEVSGPVMDYWWDYFYSKKDVESGWGSGPCYEPFSNPVDRNAHGGVPFIEYYLQQFAKASATAGYRLLDYVDLHTYMGATYNGTGVGLTTAGDTGEQIARLNSTRVFWDPTYTDPNFPQPNYSTDSDYTSSCTLPALPPQMIPRMQTWVKNDYPGTKTAITEYNWGGQEHINGALAQADILGIFGAYGLDLGALWGPPSPTTQVPGLMAFEIYRSYDGANSKFGDMSLAASSVDQSKLAVYAATRTADNMATIVVINKTYGDLSATLSLANLTPAGQAKVYLYSNANLAGIVAQAPLTVTAPVSPSTTSTVTTTFPAASITLLVVPIQ